MKGQVHRQPLAAIGCNVANQPLQVTVKSKCMIARNDMSLEVMQQGPSTVTLSGPLWTPSTQWQISRKMIEMATSAQVSADQKLRELLDIMIEENDPNLLVTLSLMRYCKVQAISCFFRNDYVSSQVTSAYGHLTRPQQVYQTSCM